MTAHGWNKYTRSVDRFSVKRCFINFIPHFQFVLACRVNFYAVGNSSNSRTLDRSLNRVFSKGKRYMKRYEKAFFRIFAIYNNNHIIIGISFIIFRRWISYFYWNSICFLRNGIRIYVREVRRCNYLLASSCIATDSDDALSETDFRESKM